MCYFEFYRTAIIKKPTLEGAFASLIVGSNQSSVTIPDGVAIENSAFAGCNNIESLTFEGTYSIYQYAFSYCTNLKDITIESCAPRYFDKTNSFNGLTTNNIKLYVPAKYVGEYVNSSYGWNIFDVSVIPGQSAKFNLIFVDDDGTTQLATKEVEYRATINSSLYPANPTKTGYTFKNWLNVPSTMPAADVTVKASYTVNQYTVKYTVDGEFLETQTYNYGATITPPTTYKAKHKFSGWTPSLPTTMPAKNLEVAGRYIPLAGDNLDWYLTEDGHLTISGTGPMYEYGGDGSVPWLEGTNEQKIKGITIAEGVTSIGAYAFFECRAVTNVTIPTSVVSIGQAAFAHCENLSSIEIPAGVITIGADAFYKCI